MNLEKARKCLKEIVDIADKEGFKTCLMFGSLLGAIREGKFLNDEYDIDLFLINLDFTESELFFSSVKDSLQENGYEIKDCSTSLFLALKKDDVLIDINLGVFLEDKFIVNSDIFIDIYPSEFFRNLKEIEFEGCKVFVPEDSEGLLTYYYGANWRTPMSLQEAEKQLMKTRIWKDR